MIRFNQRIGKNLATLSLAVAALGFGYSNAGAQEAVVGTAAVAQASAYQPRSIGDLEQLTQPIALYPDALLAQVLTASTYPNDVAAEAASLAAGSAPSSGYDPSVVGLAQEPGILNMLAGNINWTNQLGDAFLNQQPDVFTAIQALRQQALQSGALVSNAQQQVIVTNGIIQIIPANPQVIYVPQYDPQVVFVPGARFVSPCLTFDAGVSVGGWLGLDFDWCDHRIYFGDWGFNRPWWHFHAGDGGYLRIRPGLFVTRGDHRYGAWARNSSRPSPMHFRGPVVRPSRMPGFSHTHGGPSLMKNRPTLGKQTVSHPMSPAKPGLLNRGKGMVSKPVGPVHTKAPMKPAVPHGKTMANVRPSVKGNPVHPHSTMKPAKVTRPAATPPTVHSRPAPKPAVTHSKPAPRPVASHSAPSRPAAAHPAPARGKR